MALSYVTLPDNISEYGQYKKEVYAGCGLSNRLEATVRFLRGSIHKGVTVSSGVRRSYTTQSMNEWFAFDYAKIVNHSLFVRFSGIDQSTNDNWISLATISLNAPPNTGWGRVVVVNYNKDDGLFMYHLPDQNTRSGYTRHSEPVLTPGTWYRIRISLNLNTGVAELYLGPEGSEVLVESSVIGSYASYSFYNTHFGMYCYNGILTGKIDNKLVKLGFSET
jgi:hypothetical protein